MIWNKQCWNKYISKKYIQKKETLYWNYLSDSSLHGVYRRFGLLVTNTKNKNINSEYYLPTLEWKKNT